MGYLTFAMEVERHKRPQRLMFFRALVANSLSDES
jgi:hypothetical protein